MLEKLKIKKSICKLKRIIKMENELFNSSNENFLFAIKSQDSTDDRHQAVLNVAYDYWQKNHFLHWTYADMTDNTGVIMGEFAKWLVLIGKYNQQVTNGGHSQYHYNNYSERHYDLLSLTMKFKNVFTENTFNKLRKCLVGTNSLFDSYNSRKNNYHEHDYDYDEEEDYDYDEDLDSGLNSDLDIYDELYYEIYEEAMDEIVTYLNQY